MEISFQASGKDLPIVEDVLNLLDQLCKPEHKTLVAFDEFQDIFRLAGSIDRKLRSIMQIHKNINYVMLGSQESKMREIFERKKSPFYHFGQILQLSKIDKIDFKSFIISGLHELCNNPGELAGVILDFTDGHPCYTATGFYCLEYFKPGTGQ